MDLSARGLFWVVKSVIAAFMVSQEGVQCFALAAFQMKRNIPFHLRHWEQVPVGPCLENCIGFYREQCFMQHW